MIHGNSSNLFKIAPACWLLSYSTLHFPSKATGANSGMKGLNGWTLVQWNCTLTVTEPSFMFWLLQHSGTWSTSFPVLCLNYPPATSILLVVFEKRVDLFSYSWIWFFCSYGKYRSKKKWMEQKGTKETCWYVEEHITLKFGLLFMGKKTISMYCRAKQKQKQLDSWCGGQTECTRSWEQPELSDQILIYYQVFTVCDIAVLILIALSNKPDRWITMKCFLSQLKQRYSWDTSGINPLLS